MSATFPAKPARGAIMADSMKEGADLSGKEGMREIASPKKDYY
jgi:hypothetical protein